MASISSVFILYSLFLIKLSDCWIINNVDVLKLLRNVNSEFGGEDLNEAEIKALSKISLIYPGTKWCGMGNIADNIDDLGTERETDMCCREHDYCPEYLAAGETKHNLTNDNFYTRLACKCDEKFRKCLRKAAMRSSAATNIGHVYFDLLKTKCFKKDYPVLKCDKKMGFLYRRCVQYTFDTTAEKIYQWFDVNSFTDP